MREFYDSTQAWNCKKKMEKDIGDELGQEAGEREAAWYMMTENAERAAKNKVELIVNIFYLSLK